MHQPINQDETDQKTVGEILDEQYINSTKTGHVNVTLIEMLSRRGDQYSLSVDYGGFLLTTSQICYDVTEYKFEHYIKIMNNLFPLWSNSFSLNFGFYYVLQICVNNLIKINKNYQQINNDWIIKIWRPFQDDVTGIALYKNDAGNSNDVREIYRNQSINDINTTDLEIAGYIPYKFLKEITVNDLNKNLTVVMMILDGKKFKGIWQLEDDIDYFIGVGIPGYCKYDNMPLVEVFFKSDDNNNQGNWLEFGNNYIDFRRYVKELCFISKMLFFGKSNTIKDKYFESINVDYCNISYNGVNVPTNAGFVLYPAKFCMDEHLLINTQIYCDASVSENYTCSDEHLVTNKTEQFYEMLYQCTSSNDKRFCNKSLSYMTEHADTYVDVKISFHIARYSMFSSINTIKIEQDQNVLLKLLKTGLISLETYTDKPQISLLATLLRDFVELTSIKDSTGKSASSFPEGYSSIHPHLIYQKIKQCSPIIGSILYKNEDFSQRYNVKPLDASNATTYSSSDENVDVIFYVSKGDFNCSNTNLFEGECHLFVMYKKFTEYENQTCTSNVVGLYCDTYSNIENVTVYLRTKERRRLTGEYYENEGYLTIGDLSVGKLTIMYTSQLKDDLCDTTNQLTIFEQYIEIIDTNTFHLGEKTIRNIDLLSHLAISLDDSIEEIHVKHAPALKVITYLLGASSIIGIICIFLSALILKNWYKRRLSTIQLTISVAGETIFLFLNESNIAQIGYIIFYYFMLAQFAWMLIIGYMQYVRYIKVFEHSGLGTLKTSLIGWLSPAIITVISILFHLECFKCKLCSKNGEIFKNFVIIPMCLIMISNLIIYVLVMIKITRQLEQISVKTKKARRRAAILLPFILGISWIFPVILFVASTWSSVIGSYLFHIIASSQGFIVFVFVVLCDRSTRSDWYNRCTCIKKRQNISSLQMPVISSTTTSTE